jgi:DNA-directed RNA polymerase alpha subunit
MNLKKFAESLSPNEKRELLSILSQKPERRLSVKEWVNENTELSIRAQNCLTYSDLRDQFIDEVTKSDLLKVRNLGKVTMEEILSQCPFIEK